MNKNDPKTILVVGGAGYIGSHMVAMLLDRGYDAIVVDNLSSGHRDAVLGGTFYQADLADREELNNIFSSHPFDAVMHFAGSIRVDESVIDPAKYYLNNLVNTVALLEVMRSFQVNNIIFSSTAAVYGEPQYVPIDTVHPLNPINAYGKSKLMVEQILQDYDLAYGLRHMVLRYFNAAGADPAGRLGERHQPETHLIPLALQVASGKKPVLAVFGRDYPTPDGTCIRDYVHVTDLCAAHLLALEKLACQGKSATYNLGSGRGFSVQEVIDSVCKVTGINITLEEQLKRSGDPAELVAETALAKQELQWTPEFTELEIMIKHAWQSDSYSHPKG